MARNGCRGLGGEGVAAMGVAALVLLLGALGPGPAAAAGKGKLTIAYAGGAFAGELKVRPACLRARKVTILRSRPGKDRRVASARTERDGRWSARKPGAAGAFHARAKGSKRCGPARSKRITTGVERVEIAPYGFLLTGKGDAQRLKAIGRDARGRKIPGLGKPRWASSAASQVAVNRRGRARARTASGSAQITVRLAGVTSSPVLATVTAMARGAIPIRDRQIVRGPKLTDPRGKPSFESTFDVVLRGVRAPARGKLVINTESKPVVGRVAAVKTRGSRRGKRRIKLTLEQVSLQEAFPRLELHQSLDLAGAAATIDPKIAADYRVRRTGDTFAFTPKPGAARAAQRGATGTRALPPFTDCAVETTPSRTSLPISLSAPPAFTVSFNPSYELVHTAANGLERLAVRLRPHVVIEGGVKVAAAFEGKVTCKVELFVLRIPVGGPISAIIAGLVPIGVGIEAGGKMAIAAAAVTTKVEVDGNAEAGLNCPPGGNDCQFFGSLDTTAKLTPGVDLPDLGDLRFEPGLTAFGYAELAVGNPILQRLRFDAVKAKAGAKLEGSFATKASQITAADYRSSYKASLEASAGLGANLSGVAALLGLGSITGVELKESVEIASSPAGTLTADIVDFAAGQTIDFKASLEKVGFVPNVGPYNVRRVILVRDVPGNVVPAATQVASPGQTEFDLSYTASDSGSVDEFYVFAVTSLLPFELAALELARATGLAAGDEEEEYPIAAGDTHTCGVRSDTTVACWGRDTYGESSPPAGGFMQVSVGGGYSCGVRTGGPIACWGYGTSSDLAPPADAFTSVSATVYHSCGLVTNGTVKCWGDPVGNSDFGQAASPAGQFSAVSAAGAHNCALRPDGAAFCWGRDEDGESSPPAGAFRQVSAGDGAAWAGASGGHSCGIRADRSVACWGANDKGQASPPSGTFRQLSAGRHHTCGVRTDGTLACWGWNDFGQASPPAGTFRQVAAGRVHSCGVLDNGTVACWGDNPNGVASPPLGTFG